MRTHYSIKSFNQNYIICECSHICLPHSYNPDWMYNDGLLRLRYHCVACGYQPTITVVLGDIAISDFIEEIERIGFNREWQK